MQYKNAENCENWLLACRQSYSENNRVTSFFSDSVDYRLSPAVLNIGPTVYTQWPRLIMWGKLKKVIGLPSKSNRLMRGPGPRFTSKKCHQSPLITFWDILHTATLVKRRLHSAEYRLYRGQQALAAMSGRFNTAPLPLRDLPLRVRSAPLVFSDSRSPLRSAHLTFWLASLRFPLRSNALPAGTFVPIFIPILIFLRFYRAMHVVLARYCYRKSSVRLSVCLSVCPSVTLRYAEHIGWTSSKLITRIISLGSSLLGATTSAI